MPGSRPHPAWTPDPALLRGIAAYRRHPWHRTAIEPPVRHTHGAARLLDHSTPDTPPDALTLMVVPSLLNRAHILDLLPDHSMVRSLAAEGIRPLVLDWGWPGEQERSFSLADYVDGPLLTLLGACSQPVVLAGYCMGGLLALAAALRQPNKVRALVLLATPWDFHATAAPAARNLAAALSALEPVVQATGTLPVDMMQSMFAALDLDGIAAKFRRFGQMDQASEAARRFVALEDWLNDGVPLAAPVARETIGGWYGRNDPARLAWQVGGTTVDPTDLAMPCFVAIPGHDRIVPPESAAALARIIPGATVHRPNAGHIGMVAGSHADAELLRPLLHWLRGIRVAS